LNTILLAGCVQTIDDLPVGAAQVRSLGLQDREAIIREIGERAIGPQLGEVKMPCSACTEVIELPMTLADLFRL
jgi:hypothetical protein